MELEEENENTGLQSSITSNLKTLRESRKDKMDLAREEMRHNIRTEEGGTQTVWHYPLGCHCSSRMDCYFKTFRQVR